MKIVKVKLITEGTVFHYDENSTWLATPKGMEFLAVEDASNVSLFMMCNNIFTPMSWNKADFEILHEIADKPSVKEFTELTESSNREVVSLRELIGQDIKHIQL